MRPAIIIIAVMIAAPALAQTDGYYLVYGNRDGSPMRVRLASHIGVPAWGATSPDLLNRMSFLHQPLASNDSFIVRREGGYVADTAIDQWGVVDFLSPAADRQTPGYTNQSLLAIRLDDSEPGWETEGETLLICYYGMKVTGDIAFDDSIICPFVEGLDSVNAGLMWASGLFTVTPLATYPCLHLIGCENVPGDINNDSLFNALDAVYSVNYLKGYGPGPLCFRECPGHGQVAMTGDSNGNCAYNGVDVTYCINYFKGIGPTALFCRDCPPIE